MDYHDALEKRAAAAELSRGNWVKQVVIEALSHENEPLQLSERLVAVEAAVEKLGKDLALSAEAILVAITSEEKMTPQAVHEWVAANLKSG